MAERFNKTIKVELIYRLPLISRDGMRLEVFDYIEVFYNRHWLHSYLGYETPAQFELNHTKQSMKKPTQMVA